MKWLAIWSTNIGSLNSLIDELNRVSATQSKVSVQSTLENHEYVQNNVLGLLSGSLIQFDQFDMPKMSKRNENVDNLSTEILLGYIRKD